MRKNTWLSVLLAGTSGLSLALMALVPRKAAAGDGNLILNGSFERNLDNDPYPEQWRFLNYSSGGDIKWVAGDAFAGNIGLRMVCPEGHDSQVILLPASQNVARPCVEGRTYVISIYVRTEDACTTGVQMNGILADGHSWETGRVINTAGATGWTRHSWTFVAPKGIRTISPYVSHSKGTVVVDCFQVEEGSVPSDYAQAQHLYVEPIAFIYRGGTPFQPSFKIYNDTPASINTTLTVTLAQVWGAGQWTLDPVGLSSLAAGQSTRIQVTGAPANLPAGRYRLTFAGNDGQGRQCCQMSVEETLAAPDGTIPRFPVAEPAIAAEFPALADGYCRLLVAKAGLDDSLRQLNRLLYYAGGAGLADPDPTATQAVTQEINNAENVLTTSRRKYDTAYGLTYNLHKAPKPMTPEQLRQRDRLLTEVAEALTTLETGLPSLRTNLEQRMTQLTSTLAAKINPSFQPAVVGHPGRAQQELTLDANGRSTGIIWGLGGLEDNVLRLQRWLNYGFAGSFGHRPGMMDTGRLALGPDSWFNNSTYQSRQRAGLRNNSFYGVCAVGQIALSYFLGRHPGNNDIFLQTERGDIPSRGALNPWHPAVRDHVRDYCTTQAAMLAGDPAILYHCYEGEWYFGVSSNPVAHGGVESGYNLTAKHDFRNYLQAKFTTIATLNKVWGSDYASFDAVNPPPDGALKLRKAATPLTYEFEKWRSKSCADWHALAYQAIKAGDPKRPVTVSTLAGFNGSSYLLGYDMWQVLKWGADGFDTHSDPYGGLPNLIWEHSIARLLNKAQILHESEWDWCAPSPNQDERQWQATGEISLWRWMAWGRSVIDIFSAESDYVPPSKRYGQALLEMKQDYTVLRESAKFMKIAMEKANRYGEILTATRIATPKLAVLLSYTTMIDGHPSGSYGGWPFPPAFMECREVLDGLNTPRNYDHLYVPEEAVLEDGHDLGQYRAVLLPYATHFPPGLSAKLLAYMKAGGWLICSAAPGVYDQYGHPDNQVLTATLGNCAPAYVSGGESDWVWALNLTNKLPRNKVLLKDDSGVPLIVKARYGKGGILVSMIGWRTDAAKIIYFQVVNAAIGRRTAWCDQNRIELVTRVDSSGRRYLLALNLSVDKTVTDTVHVEGNFPRLTDLGIGRRFPLPAATASGVTTFQLRLERGDATMIALEPQ